jgi:hypothetical protein
VHVLVHVTVHVAPDAHVVVEPSPAVTVHRLPDAHVTLADFPAVSVHVPWLLQSRFALSPAVTVHALCAPHCVLHELPHAPVHVDADSQSNTQPLVCAVHAPPPPKSHAPPLVHEHLVPVHDAGAGAPVDVPEPDEPHASASEKETRSEAMKKDRAIETSGVVGVPGTVRGSSAQVA